MVIPRSDRARAGAAPAPETALPVAAPLRPTGVHHSEFTAERPALPTSGQREPTSVPTDALAGPNAERAQATQDALLALAGKSAEAAERLSGDVTRALVQGVLLPRSPAATGQKGVIGRAQALEAAQTLVSLPAPTFARLTRILEQAGRTGTVESPDADTERALVLKWVAAHSPGFASGMREHLLERLQSFAHTLRGLPRSELVARHTAIDINNEANDNHFNSDAYGLKNDTYPNNDGLIQVDTASCVPTDGQIVLSESDPEAAARMVRDGLQPTSLHSHTARQQRAVLERDRFFDAQWRPVSLTPAQRKAFRKDGTLPEGVRHTQGTAVARAVAAVRERLNNLEREGLKSGALDGSDLSLIEARLKGASFSRQEERKLGRALEALRKQTGGFPSEADLQTLHHHLAGGGAGMNGVLGIRDIASKATHIPYVAYGLKNAAFIEEELNTLEKVLFDGRDVPFMVYTAGESGGHAMAFTDVRGKAPERLFQVTDPWFGTTDFVPEAELLDPASDWIDRRFSVGWKQVGSILAHPHLQDWV